MGSQQNDTRSPVDPSAEVAAMAAAERKRWLTVAEGQQVRKQWDSLVDGVTKALEKYDENPEDEAEAIVFIVLSGLLAHSFTTAAINAGTKIKGLS